MRSLPPRALLLAAVCSGAATLAYELIWLRTLTLTVGATFPAITVVFAGIMTGLGIGSMLGGRLADRIHDPQRAYAAVEIAVAVLGVSFPFLALWVTAIELPAVGPFSGRALLAGLAMLPATTLIGTTFPLLSAALHRGDGGEHVPRLYAANTIGAALGCVLGGLVLPYALGIVGALLFAAALNVAAAGLAFSSARSPRPATPAPVAPGAPPWQLLGLSAGSGLLLAVVQLFWTRSILQFERFTSPFTEASEVVAVVLATLLLGNGLGGVLAERLKQARLSAVARPLAWLWLAGALLMALSVEWLAVRLWGLSGALSEVGTTGLVARLSPILLASVLLGTSFPLLARLYAGALPGHGDRMGRIWALNTAGAVAGSVIGGWWLMPLLGTDRGLLLCAALALVLAAAVVTLGGGRAEKLGIAGVTAVTAATSLLVPLGPGQQFRRQFGADTVVASWEGWESTTFVGKISAEGEPHLYSNGRGMTGVESYVRGGRSLADGLGTAEEVLLVGFGTGGLAAGLLEQMRGRRLTIVEIDGAQLQAAEWFGTSSVLTDPRVEVVVDDAVHFLDSTDRTFDAVVIDGWGPEASPALYTADFHQRILEHLSDRGETWAKLGTTADESMPFLQDAFRCTYPLAFLSMDGQHLIGARRPLPIPVEQLPPADASCDPLTWLRPRRIHAVQPTAAEVAEARGGREGQEEWHGPGPDPNKLAPSQAPGAPHQPGSAGEPPSQPPGTPHAPASAEVPPGRTPGQHPR